MLNLLLHCAVQPCLCWVLTAGLHAFVCVMMLWYQFADEVLVSVSCGLGKVCIMRVTEYVFEEACIQTCRNWALIACSKSSSSEAVRYGSEAEVQVYLWMKVPECSSRESHRGHKQGHVTLLSTQPAPFIEEVLEEALHLQRPLKVQQALPAVVSLPTCYCAPLQASKHVAIP